METFNAVRTWAYRLVLPHKADGGSLETWRMACTGAAEQFTGEHHDPALHELDAGQAELKKELREFREDMGQRLGRQWQTNQNIERHLRKLAGDSHLSIVAEG